MSDFEIKLAVSRRDIESAQRLRFEVFNLEMKKGLEASYATGLDADEFDDICDHILIIDKNNGRVIGTYRLLLGKKIGPEGRFYAQKEFDLAHLRPIKEKMLEMGRSCVHKDYRRDAVVMLLWAGIIDYVRGSGARYISGCPSVYATQPEDISAILALFKKKYYAPPSLRVVPVDGKAFAGLADCPSLTDAQERQVMLKVPSLVRSYLKFGALVCGEPALDAEFGTVDFFMLLDMEKISQKYLRRLRLGQEQ